MAVAALQRSALFRNVRYYVSGDVPPEVDEVLQAGGAEQAKYFTDFVTHLICGRDASEADLVDAEELYEIPVASWRWVRACQRLGRVVSARPYRPARSRLFADVVACVARVSPQDAKALFALLTYHGGRVRLTFDRRCTHLVCGAAAGTRYAAAYALPPGRVAIVTPDWVTDSVVAGEIAAKEPYHPALLASPPPPPPDSSAVFDFEESIAKTEVSVQNDDGDVDGTLALVDKLKQRMPFGRRALVEEFAARRCAAPRPSAVRARPSNANANARFGAPRGANPLQIRQQRALQLPHQTQTVPLHVQPQTIQQLVGTQPPNAGFSHDASRPSQTLDMAQRVQLIVSNNDQKGPTATLSKPHEPTLMQQQIHDANAARPQSRAASVTQSMTRPSTPTQSMSQQQSQNLIRQIQMQYGQQQNQNAGSTQNVSTQMLAVNANGTAGQLQSMTSGLNKHPGLQNSMQTNHAIAMSQQHNQSHTVDRQANNPSNVQIQAQPTPNIQIQSNWRQQQLNQQQLNQQQINQHQNLQTIQGSISNQQMIRNNMLQQQQRNQMMLQQQHQNLVQNSQSMLQNQQIQQNQHIMSQSNPQSLQQPNGQMPTVQQNSQQQQILIQKQIPQMNQQILNVGQQSNQHLLVNQQMNSNGQLLVQNNQHISLQNNQQIMSQNAPQILTQNTQQIISQGQTVISHNAQQIICSNSQQILPQSVMSGCQSMMSPNNQSIISSGNSGSNQQMIAQPQQILTQSGQQIMVQGNQQIPQSHQVISHNQVVQNGQQVGTQQQIMNQTPQLIQQHGVQSHSIGKQILGQGQQIAAQSNQQLISQQSNQQTIAQQIGQQMISQTGQQIINPQQIMNQQAGQQIIGQQTPQQIGQQIMNQQAGQQLLQQVTQQTGQQMLSQQSGQQMLSQQPGQQMLSQQPGQQILNQQPVQQILNQQPVQQILNQQTGQQLLNQQSGQQILNQQPGQQMISQQSGQQLVSPQSGQQIISQQGGQQILSQQGGQQILSQQGGQQIISQQPGQQMISQQAGQQMISQQPGQQMITWQQQQFLQQRQQQIITGQPGAVGQRVSWRAGPGRQVIQLDAQTHIQLKQMDPQQRALFVAQLQKRYQLSAQRTVQQQVQHPASQTLTLVRGQLTPGVNSHQQVQWVQQQGIRAANPGSVETSVIAQQPQQIQQPQTNQQQQHQQQQQYAQLQLRQQQHQRMQRIQGTNLQGAITNQGILPPRQIVGSALPEVAPQQPDVAAGQQTLSQDQVIPVAGASPLVVNPRTKTALANLLNIRLQNTQPSHPQDVNEPSAAGTLRLMNAAHNAPPRAPTEVVQTLQQRRALNPPQGTFHHQLPVSPHAHQQAHPKPAYGVPNAQAVVGSSGRNPTPSPLPTGPIPRVQYYGHNPNLKLPADLFLLGCIFHVVEYNNNPDHNVKQWIDVLSRHGGEVESNYCPRVTHVLAQTQKHGVVMQALRDSKRCVTAFWLSDTMVRRQVAPPWQALHLPLMYALHDRPALRHRASISGFIGEERDRVRFMIEHTGAKITSYMSKDNTILICKKPEGKKYQRAREWNIPVVSVQWLTDLLLGNMTALTQVEHSKYQQFNVPNSFRIDYTLVPHLMNPWKMPINITQESHEKVKRGALPTLSSHKSKKPRLDQALFQNLGTFNCVEKPDPSIAPRVMFSSMKDIEPCANIVRLLGGFVVTQPSEATHLVMGKLVRTIKFISALIHVKHILTIGWLVEGQKIGKFAEECKFALCDDSFDELFKCNIANVISVPPVNRAQLFSGVTFYMTPGVQPSRSILTEMIEMCGGKVDKNRKSYVSIQEIHKEKPYSYLVLTVMNDLHLVYYLLQAEKNLNIVCNTELVLTSIMRQKIDVLEHLVKIN